MNVIDVEDSIEKIMNIHSLSGDKLCTPDGSFTQIYMSVIIDSTLLTSWIAFHQSLTFMIKTF